MKLSDREWKPFILEKIFRIESGKRLESYNMTHGIRPFIGATDNGNGITNYVSDENESLDKNVLGVNYNGNGMAISFYHPYECIFSDDVKRFHLKETDDNKYVFLFFKTIILQQKPKYNYGYKFNANRMKRQIILVPVNEIGEPDYAFMEQYVKEKRASLIERYNNYIKNKISNIQYQKIEPLENKVWKSFPFIKVFIIKGGFYNKKPPIETGGTIPFIGATESNNGITEFYSLKNIDNNSKTGNIPNEPLEKKVFDGNCICVTNNGSVGFAYYQSHKFTCSHDVNPLYANGYEMNEYLAQFLISAIEKQKVCFTYVRKWRPKRMVKSKILLPINEAGEPDYEYMEQYIKNLMVKKYNEYISYIKK